MRARLTRLTLTDFRSYRQESLETGGRSAFLFGPNGAGKTNLLEAISLFFPAVGFAAPAPASSAAARKPTPSLSRGRSRSTRRSANKPSIWAQGWRARRASAG